MCFVCGREFTDIHCTAIPHHYVTESIGPAGIQLTTVCLGGDKMRITPLDKLWTDDRCRHGIPVNVKCSIC